MVEKDLFSFKEIFYYYNQLKNIQWYFMGSLIVQAGTLKNKRIPMVESLKGHTNFTPALIKKAVFAMIESQVLSGNLHLEQAIFIDLFSGSGQMGLEAVSRGFKSAHLFEIDRSRINFLLKNVSPLSEKLFIHNKDSFRFFDKIEKEKEDIFVYFLDPPYSFWKVPDKINNLLQGINNSNIGNIIYLQSPDEPINYTDKYSRFGNNYIFAFS
jgi:16S rRNA (guanine966-N2)-methyltransferase